jgi:phospholipid/cholesterol/gamma-HCH transport system substrate-binding protein
MVDLLPAGKVPQQCLALAQTLNARHLPMPDQLRKLLGLPLGGAPGKGAPAGNSPAAPAGPPAAPGPTTDGDPTLGGILRGGR